MTYLIKIEGTDITPYLSSYEVGYEQMFTEANRNLAGVLRASYIGTAPKIYLKTRQLTKAETSTLMGLVNDSSFTVEWYDEETDSYKVDEFYRGDFKVGIRDMNSEMYRELSFNLISYGTLEVSA